MNVSRRSFALGLGVGLLAPLVPRAWGEVNVAPQLTAGVLSDTHLKLTDAPDLLVGAFRAFKRKGVDVVVIAGDVVEDGRVAEYAYFLKIWREVFGDRPGQSGAPELVLAWGNHDYRSASKYRAHKPDSADENDFMLNRKDEVWRMIFEEPFPGEIYTRTIKGVPFVMAHWGHENAIGLWLKEHAASIDTSSFFVYVQHPHPSGTVFGSVTNAVQATADLKSYPNCFAISGHSHTTISDDAALWQGGFTSMAAGCLKNGAVRHGSGIAAFANGNLKDAKGRVQHMKPCSGGASSQGSLLRLFADRMTVERIDFLSGNPLGDDWVLSLPLERHPEAPFVFPARARGPEFPPTAQVSVSISDALLVLKVHQAHPVDKFGRAIWNRFEILDAESQAVVLSSDTLQPGQSMPIKAGLKRSAEWAFPKADLPSVRSLRLRVTAYNAAGIPGRPLDLPLSAPVISGGLSEEHRGAI